ncbi:MAG TPA: hypothetical protein VFG53_19900 [Anaeromyxobacter sp.]|nr:hypothetical protein [Anaeromyxobacter sp.]
MPNVNAQRARRLKKQLSTEEVRERIHLSEEHLRVLDAIILRPHSIKLPKVRLDGLALMLAYSQPKPAQQLDVRQAVIQITDPYRESNVLPVKANAEVPAPEPGPRTLAEKKAAEWRAEHELRQLQATPPAPAAPAKGEPAPARESHA